MFFHRRQTERHLQEACSRPAAEAHLCQGYASAFVTAQDGLTLHVRRYGSRHASAHSVVCLPGLARTAADFHPLATALAADPANPRLVLAVDYRGLQRRYSLPGPLAHGDRTARTSSPLSSRPHKPCLCG